MILVDTGSSNFWVESNTVLNNSVCVSSSLCKSVSKFYPEKSSTFQKIYINGSQANFSIVYGDGSTALGY